VKPSGGVSEESGNCSKWRPFPGFMDSRFVASDACTMTEATHVHSSSVKKRKFFGIL